MMLMLTLSVSADQFHAQILSGGKISISVNPSQGYTGTLEFAASNMASDTAVFLLGNAEPFSQIAAPPGSSATLYSILLNFYPHYTCQFKTTGQSTL